MFCIDKAELRACSLCDNSAGRGGGAFNAGASTMRLITSTVARNHARTDGGGVFNASTGILELPDTTIAFNADGLPNTFVPGRNIIFLSFAATIAYRRGIKHIVAGMCETDYSGYPDCRDDTIKALQVALNLGMDRRFVLETPLMWLDKAATWRLAENLGGASLVEALLEHTHSCYLGDRRHRHAWGYGCGTCPACDLRAKGWAAYAAAETP